MAGSTAPRKVVVDIVGDAKGYKKATDEAVKASTGFAGKMDALDRKLEAMGRRGGVTGALLGGAGVGVGLGVFSLVERGISSVVGAMGDAVQSAIEDERATAKLTQTIQANVRAWDGQLDAVNAAIDAGAQLAFTDDEVRDGLNQLIPRTKDLGEAIRLNALAMDLARAKGMGLEEAATLVGKAYSGQASALRRAGIAIKNTKDSTAALAELQRAVSGQADTYAKTTEGAMQRLDIQLSEAMESLGYALKPLVASLAGLASSIIPQVVAAVGLFGEAMHNLQRIADPTLATTEDLNYAIIAQASAYGVGADKVIAYKDALLATRAAEAARLDLVKDLQANLSETDQYFQNLAKQGNYTADEAKNRFIEGQVKRLEAMARSFGLTLEQLRAASPLLVQAGDTVDAYLDRLAQLSMAYAETGVEAEQINKTVAEQGLEFVRLYAASQKVEQAGQIVVDAFAGMFSGARKAANALATVPDAVRVSLDPLTSIVKGTLKRAKETARREMAELAWALKHPMTDERLKGVWANELNGAYRALHKAQNTGNAIAIAKAEKLIRELKSRFFALSEAQFVLRVGYSYTPGAPLSPVGDPPRPPRAGGGQVRRNQAYLVGEHRPEVYVPEDDGVILPSVAAAGRSGGGGGGGTSITLNVTVNAAPGANGFRIGQELAGYLEQYARGGGQAHLKRLVTSGSR